MLSLGLLWFDDDNRRSPATKITDAVTRFEERTGLRATSVHVNPIVATALAPAKSRSGRSVAGRESGTPRLPVKVIGDEYLGRHYYLVGIEEGETPRAVRVARTARAARKNEAPRIGHAEAELPDDRATARRSRKSAPRQQMDAATQAQAQPRARRIRTA